MKGKVKWFNDQKGFGFITPEGGARDLFVHHSDIVADGYRTLNEGQEVEFEEAESDKGPKAINVKGMAEEKKEGLFPEQEAKE